MSGKHYAGALLLILAWQASHIGAQPPQQNLQEAFKSALSKLPKIHPNALHYRDAAKAFTDKHNDVNAVVFLKKIALDVEGKIGGRAGQTVAMIGLALLAQKHETTTFLKSHVGSKYSVSSGAFLAISFLPAKVARRLAEEIVLDTKQVWRNRAAYLLLLRAVGDQSTMEKLEKMERGKIAPGPWAVHARTVRFLQRRLELKNKVERERWARQELLFLRITYSMPNFRGIGGGLYWSAQQIRQKEKDFSATLLEAKLGVRAPPRKGDYAADVHVHIPIAAMLAVKQRNTELLPLLDRWAAADFGYVSYYCKRAAEELRSKPERSKSKSQ